VADRARRSGTSGSPGGRFPARESSVFVFPSWCFSSTGSNKPRIRQSNIIRDGKTRNLGRIGSYPTPGKGHRARGELTRPRRASTSSPRARCEARARAFRVFPVAIFRKSAHLPVLKTVSYTISRRKVISERRKVVIITGTLKVKRFKLKYLRCRTSWGLRTKSKIQPETLARSVNGLQNIRAHIVSPLY
jgi:hypothetical protein